MRSDDQVARRVGCLGALTVAGLLILSIAAALVALVATDGDIEW